MNERGKVTENQLICSSVEDLDLVNWISWVSSVLGSNGWNTSMAHSKFAERTLEGTIRTWRTKWSQQFLERRMLGRGLAVGGRNGRQIEWQNYVWGRDKWSACTEGSSLPYVCQEEMRHLQKMSVGSCMQICNSSPTDLPHACILELVKSLTKKVRGRVQGCRTGQRQE